MNYQAEYGGKIHKLTDVEIKHIETKNNDNLKIREYDSEDKNYYILNLKDKTQL